MLELFGLGEYFLYWLNPIGDWLLYKPDPLPDWVMNLFTSLSSTVLGASSTDFFSSFFNSLNGQSIAMWIFGAGLIGILGFKLVKFILDIVL